MSGKRVGGIVCFVLAAVLLVAGISTVFRGPDIVDASGLGFGQAVGAFLPAFGALIVGLLLFKKPN